MDKHIVSLLKQKNRVIIPELGAFIVKQSTPKTYVFNEFLKYNDGMLIEHVMKEENISKDEATTKVDNYVIDINSKLNIGEAHSIDMLGTLKKDRGGKVQFAPDDMADQTSLYKEEPKKEPKPEKDAVKEKTHEEKPKQEDETPIELIDDTEKQQEDKKEEKKTNENKDLASEKKETPPPVVPPVQKREPRKADQQEKQPTIKPQTEKTKKESIYNQNNTRYQPKIEPQKKNAKTGIWIALIAVVVVAIGVWIYLNRDFIFGSNGAKQAQQETVLGPSGDQPSQSDEPVSDENMTDGAAENQPSVGQEQPSVTAEPEKQQPEPVAQPVGKRYYIVAGCFQNENNAVDYAAHLRGQGYDAQKFGKYGGLHAVSFESFGNYNEALKQLNKVRNNVEPEAWILYY